MFGINVTFGAYFFAALLIIGLMIDTVRAVWQHNVFKALRSFGFVWAVAGIVSALVHNYEWAMYGIYKQTDPAFGYDPSEPIWGYLPDELHWSFFVIAAVFLVAAAIVKVVMRIRQWRDRVALAPSEASVRAAAFQQ